MAKSIPHPTTAPDRDQTAIDTVALLGKNRLSKLAIPLRAAGLEVYENPVHYDIADVIVTDTPHGWGQGVAKPAVDSPADVPVVYRMRGDYWREVSRECRLAWLKTTVATQLAFPAADALLALDDRLVARWDQLVGTGPTAAIGVPIDPDEWVPYTHHGRVETLLTLTNFNFADKVAPLYDYLDAVEAFLAGRDGVWWVAGDGPHAETFADAVADYDHIDYVGYIDPESWFGETDVYLHPSALDTAYPNAVLEAMASNLPTVVSNHTIWGPNDHAIRASPTRIGERLAALDDPVRRDRLGAQARAYLNHERRPAAMGARMAAFLERVHREVVADG